MRTLIFSAAAAAVIVSSAAADEPDKGFCDETAGGAAVCLTIAGIALFSLLSGEDSREVGGGGYAATGDASDAWRGRDNNDPDDSCFWGSLGFGTCH